MKLNHSQKGMTFWSLSFVLLLIGIVVYTSLKLIPVYLQSFSVESAVRSLESDRGETYTGAMSVRTTLMKRILLDNVDVLHEDDIAVVRENNYYLINVDYEVRVPYFRNIDLLLTFSHKAKALSN